MRVPNRQNGICRLCERKHRGKDLFCRACQRELKSELNMWLEIKRIQNDVRRVDRVLNKAAGIK